MKDYCVPLHLAQKLKKAGFKEPCLFGYEKLDMFFKDLKNDNQEFSGVNYNASGYCCSAPFWEQVSSWFRKEHNMEVGVVPTFYEMPGYNAYAGDYVKHMTMYGNIIHYGDYEHARDIAFSKAIDKINGVVEKVEYKKEIRY